MTETAERAPEYYCLSNRLQCLFGAFATVPVLYFLHLRMTGRQELPEHTAGHCSPKVLLAYLHQFWREHAAIFNPAMKMASTEEPSEECLFAVLSALRTDRMSQLPADCLTDPYSVPADPAQQKSAKKMAVLSVSGGGNITVQKIRHQSRKNSRRPFKEAPSATQLICDYLNVRGKLMLCASMPPVDNSDLGSIVKAQCDYICAIPVEEYYDEITPEEISYYLRTYLESDTAKELCLSEDKDISGFFRRCTDQDGNTVTESMQQCGFMNFVDYYIETCAEECMQDKTHSSMYSCEEEWRMMVEAHCENLQYELGSWHDEGGAQSILYTSHGKQASAFTTSLHCRHQKDYLLRMQQLLSDIPVPAKSRQIFTLTDLAPADDRLQSDRLNLQANLQKADALAEKVLTVALAMLHKLRASAVSQEALHSVFCSNQDAAALTALHFMRAYYTGKDRHLLRDPLLQGTLLQNVSAGAEQSESRQQK